MCLKHLCSNLLFWLGGGIVDKAGIGVAEIIDTNFNIVWRGPKGRGKAYRGVAENIETNFDIVLRGPKGRG